MTEIPNPYARVEISTVIGQSSLDPAGGPVETSMEQRFLDCSTTSVAVLWDEDGNDACVMRLIRIEPQIFILEDYTTDPKDTLKVYGPLWREGGEYPGSGPMITPSMMQLLAVLGPKVPWIAVEELLGGYEKGATFRTYELRKVMYRVFQEFREALKLPEAWFSGILFIDAIDCSDPGLPKTDDMHCSTVEYLWEQVFLSMGPNCFAVAMRRDAQGCDPFGPDLFWVSGSKQPHEFGPLEDLILWGPCTYEYGGGKVRKRRVLWDSDQGRFTWR